jgi:hypothetical protein
MPFKPCKDVTSRQSEKLLPPECIPAIISFAANHFTPVKLPPKSHAAGFRE